MQTKNLICSNLKLLPLLTIILLFNPTVEAAAGRVEFSVGTVYALNANGIKHDIAKGDDINKGDTLITEAGSRVQLRFTDGGYISLQPNSEFNVKDYNFNGKPDGTELSIFGLIKGGFRAITGAIGHTKRSAYRVDTPVATIGIRGTEYLLIQDGANWYVRVGDGSVYMQNEGGDLVLFKGQAGIANSRGIRPKSATNYPKVNARDPDINGITPQDTDSMATIFTNGEQYNNDGFPRALDIANTDPNDRFPRALDIANTDPCYANACTFNNNF